MCPWCQLERLVWSQIFASFVAMHEHPGYMSAEYSLAGLAAVADRCMRQYVNRFGHELHDAEVQ